MRAAIHCRAKPRHPWLLVAILVVVAGDAPGSYANEELDRTKSYWIGSHYQEILDAVLPIERGRSKLPTGVDALVSVRPGEHVVTLRRYSSGRVDVTLTGIAGGLLGDQLESIVTAVDSPAVEEIVPRLKITTISVTDEACPALRAWARRFESVDFATWSRAGLVIHGTRYEFHIRSLAFRLDGEVQGIAGARKNAEPLVEWFEGFRKALVEECHVQW